MLSAIFLHSLTLEKALGYIFCLTTLSQGLKSSPALQIEFGHVQHKLHPRSFLYYSLFLHVIPNILWVTIYIRFLSSPTLYMYKCTWFVTTCQILAEADKTSTHHQQNLSQVIAMFLVYKHWRHISFDIQIFQSLNNSMHCFASQQTSGWHIDDNRWRNEKHGYNWTKLFK